MITERMSWAEIAREVYADRVDADRLVYGRTYKLWSRDCRGRTRFPVFYSASYVSRSGNRCTLALRAESRSEMGSGKARFVVLTEMQTAHGTYLVLPKDGAALNEAGRLLVISPHAINRYGQRACTGKSGEALRAAMSRRLTTTGVIVFRNDFCYLDIEDGILLGCVLDGSVFMMKTFIGHDTFTRMHKKFSRRSISSRNLVKDDDDGVAFTLSYGNVRPFRIAVNMPNIFKRDPFRIDGLDMRVTII